MIYFSQNANDFRTNVPLQVVLAVQLMLITTPVSPVGQLAILMSIPEFLPLMNGSKRTNVLRKYFNYRK